MAVIPVILSTPLSGGCGKHVEELDPELAQELSGLPAVIDKALRGHERPRRRPDKTVCSNPECEWIKPIGVNIKRAWHKHQVWAIHMSVREWYVNG